MLYCHSIFYRVTKSKFCTVWLVTTKGLYPQSPTPSVPNSRLMLLCRAIASFACFSSWHRLSISTLMAWRCSLSAAMASSCLNTVRRACMTSLCACKSFICWFFMCLINYFSIQVGNSLQPSPSVKGYGSLTIIMFVPAILTPSLYFPETTAQYITGPSCNKGLTATCWALELELLMLPATLQHVKVHITAIRTSAGSTCTEVVHLPSHLIRYVLYLHTLS